MEHVQIAPPDRCSTCPETAEFVRFLNGEASDGFMGFGKHADAQRSWVKQNDPGYCYWCARKCDTYIELDTILPELVLREKVADDTLDRRRAQYARIMEYMHINNLFPTHYDGTPLYPEPPLPGEDTMSSKKTAHLLVFPAAVGESSHSYGMHLGDYSVLPRIDNGYESENSIFDYLDD